jgi:hypothetical protein
MVETRLKTLVADELDGARAQRHVREITVYHRSLGSAEWHQAADDLKQYLDGIGLEVTSIDEPLNNTTRIGNYTIPYAWEPHDAVLKVVEPEERTLVNFKESPTCINSWSGATPPSGVVAEVVHVGAGTKEADYAGKDVRGKIVFTDKGYSWRVHALAVEKHGAIGFINDDIREIPYAKTREMFPDFVLWNTLYERQMDGSMVQGWGLTISPRSGDYLRELLNKGPVKLYAKVDCRTFVGLLVNPMGIIRGSTYPDEEVMMVAHLCHTRPGAVDNAAGCAHITEVMRAINVLIERGDIPQPKRTIKAFYGPEGHHNNIYYSRLEKEGKLGDVIVSLCSHVGGDPEKLKGPLRMNRTSAALPSFLNDLCLDYLEQVNEQYPSPGPRAKVPFIFESVPLFMGGDSLQDSAWGIPAIEMMRVPNIYWHTPHDTVDKTSPEEFTKLGWVYAMVALTVANAGLAETVEIMQNVEARSESRLNEVSRAVRGELLEAEPDEVPKILEMRVDKLRYLQERDGKAIASALVLLRNDDEGVRRTAQKECDKLIEKLAHKVEREEKSLWEFSELLYGSLAPLEAEPLPPEALWRPKMKQLGMLDMKRLTLDLADRYEGVPGMLEHLDFVGYMYEVCNLSDGENAVGEIARMLHHELDQSLKASGAPAEGVGGWRASAVDVVARMVKDLESLGHMTVSKE